MGFADRFYKQDITYWAITSEDRFGKPVFASPVVFQGRWEDKKMQLLGKSGTTINSQSMVNFPDTVDIEIDGYVYLGISAALDPTQVQGAYQVQQVQTLPDLRNIDTVKVAML